MLKLVKKHDWLELKAENLLLKEELEIERERNKNLQDQIDAWHEKKPYCGKHCEGCKHSFTIKNSYLTPMGIRTDPERGCYLNAGLSCYLFDRKEEG